MIFTDKVILGAYTDSSSNSSFNSPLHNQVMAITVAPLSGTSLYLHICKYRLVPDRGATVYALFQSLLVKEEHISLFHGL